MKKTGSRAREEHPVEPAGIGGWKQNLKFDQQKFRSVRRRWGGAAAFGREPSVRERKEAAPACPTFNSFCLLRQFGFKKTGSRARLNARQPRLQPVKKPEDSLCRPPVSEFHYIRQNRQGRFRGRPSEEISWHLSAACRLFKSLKQRHARFQPLYPAMVLSLPQKKMAIRPGPQLAPIMGPM